jgi:hypothetical protein
MPVVTEDESYRWGSYPLALRDAFLAVAMGLPTFDGYTVRRTRALPIMPEDLPILGCYIGDEAIIPDGAGNQGDLCFEVTTKLGFSIMIVQNDPDQAERTLEGAYASLMYALWTNPNLTNMLDTTDYDTGLGTPLNARFEAVTRQQARTVWGAFLLNNETPVAEKQYDIWLKFRRPFTPVLPHDFDGLTITTGLPHDGTPEQRERIQQVRQRLSFAPAAPRSPLKERFHG